ARFEPLAAGPARACQVDARVAVQQQVEDLAPADAEARAVPLDPQRGRVVGEARGLDDLRGDAGDLLDAAGDRVQVAFPGLPLGLVVAAVPAFDGCQHPHDLFLAHLARAAERVVRRAVDPGRLAQF